MAAPNSAFPPLELLPPVDGQRGGPPPAQRQATDGSAKMLTPSPFVEMPGMEAFTSRTGLPERELVQMLNSYLDEAREARQDGPEGREDTWRRNWEAYWSRFDYSDKAPWQHQAMLPEVANFVERRAARLRELLVSHGANYHETVDPLDPNGKISHLADRIMAAVLARCGVNKTGHRVAFPRVLSDLAKSGALMNLCAAVTPAPGGCKVEAVDPREIFLDPSGENLYRIREYEIAKHKVHKMKAERHADGTPVWNAAAIDRLLESRETEQLYDKYRSKGHGNAEGNTFRQMIDIHEYLCTILDRDGNLIAENQLVVMGNRNTIIRGPEPNPFWHKRDWIVYGSLIPVPFSTYGRSEVEGYREVAETFIDLTNQIMDQIAAQQNAYMMWPEALDDPAQIEEGVSPNKLFLASEDWGPERGDFIRKIEMGRIYPEMFEAWKAMKAELMEAASQNELQLGMLGKKSGTTATEAGIASQGASSLDKARAGDLEEGFIDPILDLVWATTIQTFDPEVDTALASELGPELSAMLVAQRQEFRTRTFRMRSRAISSGMDRGERLQGLLGFLNVVSSNQQLAEIFMRQHSLAQLIMLLLTEFGIDPDGLRKSDQEMIAERLALAQQAAAGAQAGQPGASPASPSSLNPGGTRAPGPAALGQGV